MRIVTSTISVSGFTDAEAAEGIPHLIEEFQHRPWMLNPAAHWDAERSRLVITVGYAGDDREAAVAAATDEVWDCVIACLNFSSEGIHFDVDGVEVGS
jgi:hypothetical protein